MEEKWKMQRNGIESEKEKEFVSHSAIENVHEEKNDKRSLYREIGGEQPIENRRLTRSMGRDRGVGTSRGEGEKFPKQVLKQSEKLDKESSAAIEKKEEMENREEEGKTTMKEKELKKGGRKRKRRNINTEKIFGDEKRDVESVTPLKEFDHEGFFFASLRKSSLTFFNSGDKVYTNSEFCGVFTEEHGHNLSQ